ncbi:hypothetical protein TorRG33x02_004800 [Trema orientale]|uniref:Uncharacterized protein n=1 Tax=Trema orientale TaxID=63057 RepID=A0A2P5G2B7_TREOI|nr:hypothetical protein TorRG33x02_004800 [Trema orientale]
MAETCISTLDGFHCSTGCCSSGGNVDFQASTISILTLQQIYSFQESLDCGSMGEFLWRV